MSKKPTNELSQNTIDPYNLIQINQSEQVSDKSDHDDKPWAQVELHGTAILIDTNNKPKIGDTIAEIRVADSGEYSEAGEPILHPGELLQVKHQPPEYTEELRNGEPNVYRDHEGRVVNKNEMSRLSDFVLVDPAIKGQAVPGVNKGILTGEKRIIRGGMSIGRPKNSEARDEEHDFQFGDKVSRQHVWLNEANVDGSDMLVIRDGLAGSIGSLNGTQVAAEKERMPKMSQEQQKALQFVEIDAPRDRLIGKIAGRMGSVALHMPGRQQRWWHTGGRPIRPRR